MKRLLLALALIATPIYAQEQDANGNSGVFLPPISTEVAVTTGSEVATLDLQGRTSVMIEVITSDLDAAIESSCSADNGATFFQGGCAIANTTSRVANIGSTTITGVNTRYLMAIPPGTTQARVSFLTYTSGTATLRLIASYAPDPTYANDGVPVVVPPGLDVDATIVTDSVGLAKDSNLTSMSNRVRDTNRILSSVFGFNATLNSLNEQMTFTSPATLTGAAASVAYHISTTDFLGTLTPRVLATDGATYRNLQPYGNSCETVMDGNPHEYDCFFVVPAGANTFVIEATAYTSGSANVTGNAIPAPGVNMVAVRNAVAGKALTAAEGQESPLCVDSTGHLCSIAVTGTVTTGGLTDTQLRATPVPVSGTVTTGGLTDTQLRATPVPVSGTVSAVQSGTWTVQPGNTANTTAWKVDGSAVTQPVSGPLTDTQLRTAVVHVDGQVAEDAASASNPVQVGGQARKDRKTAMSAEDDSVRAAYDMYGRANVLGIKWTPTYLQVTSSGATTIVAAGGSGVRTRVFRVECSNSSLTTPLSVGLKSPSMFSGAVFGLKYIPQAGGLAVWMLGNSYLETGNNEAFQINLSVAGQVDCTTYTESVVN